MSKEIKTLLVDADGLVYRVGFANKEHEPLSHTLQSAKTVITNIGLKFPGAELKLYLTGKSNYRDKVSVTRVYKGNRDPLNKPEYYDEIREYYLSYFGAAMIEEMEADDALGIEQWANKDRSTCIVTIDKDLNGIPGWHYNPVRDELFYVTLAEANKFFWYQVLIGDTTDNIQGIPKVGPKKAEKILAGKDTWYDQHMAVLEAYRAYYGDAAETVLHEMATLCWMQRKYRVNYDGELIEAMVTPLEVLEEIHEGHEDYLEKEVFDDDDIPF